MRAFNTALSKALIIQIRRLINPHQVHEHGPRDMFSRSRLREEGVEGVISTTDSLIGGHLPIGLDSMFEAVELPTCVTDLATSLTDVD